MLVSVSWGMPVSALSRHSFKAAPSSARAVHSVGRRTHPALMILLQGLTDLCPASPGRGQLPRSCARSFQVRGGSLHVPGQEHGWRRPGGLKPIEGRLIRRGGAENAVGAVAARQTRKQLLARGRGRALALAAIAGAVPLIDLPLHRPRRRELEVRLCARALAVRRRFLALCMRTQQAESSQLLDDSSILSSHEC